MSKTQGAPAGGDATAGPSAAGITDTPAAVDAREALERELAAARSELETAFADVLRARAELDNVRKRAQREIEQAHRYALERYVTELLPVCDSLELGVEAAASTRDVDAMREGIELTLKMLQEAFGRTGVEPLAPAAGERFDPELHQAMGMEESSDCPPGTVLRVMQKGYRLNDRLLRPALVVVARGG
jgi:molecular chaperone GrpE